jgi:hypothetical protein
VISKLGRPIDQAAKDQVAKDHEMQPPISPNRNKTQKCLSFRLATSTASLQMMLLSSMGSMSRWSQIRKGGVGASSYSYFWAFKSSNCVFLRLTVNLS